MGAVQQASTYCHYAEAGGVHALLAGEVSEWPGLDMVAAHHDGARLPCYVSRTARRTLCAVGGRGGF